MYCPYCGNKMWQVAFESPVAERLSNSCWVCQCTFWEGMVLHWVWSARRETLDRVPMDDLCRCCRQTGKAVTDAFPETLEDRTRRLLVLACWHQGLDPNAPGAVGLIQEPNPWMGQLNLAGVLWLMEYNDQLKGGE